MGQLRNGLYDARRYEDALSVQEAQLSMLRRLDAAECEMLLVQTCLANSHAMLGRNEQALNMLRNVYSGRVRLNGEQHQHTMLAALNLAGSLIDLRRFEEAKTLMRKMIPVARRVLGPSHDHTLRMRWTCAMALFKDDGATLDDLREAVRTLEDADRTARRVLGGAHPLTVNIERALQNARAALGAAPA